MFIDKMNKMINKMCVALLGLALNNTAVAQQNTEERIPFKEIDGHIVLKASVGGEEANLLLDTRGRLALTEAAAQKREIVYESSGMNYPRTAIETIGIGSAHGFFIGQGVYAPDVRVMVIGGQEQLQHAQAEGYLGIGSFINQIMTIDKKSRSLILSNYYRPAFIKLGNRADLRVDRDKFFLTVRLGGQVVEALLDLNQAELFRVGSRDKVRLANHILKKDGISLQIAQTSLPLNEVSVAEEEEYSLVGRSILDKGVISFDVTKGKYYFQSYEENYTPVSIDPVSEEEFAIVAGKVNPISSKDFLKYIYDYRSSDTWKLKGDKPVVIDFWASWCAPCLRMMPIIEELAEKYKDEVVFYKVNIDKEGELRRVFEANAIPLLIFGPLKGKEVRDIGADSKEKIEARIEAMLN